MIKFTTKIIIMTILVISTIEFNYIKANIQFNKDDSIINKGKDTVVHILAEKNADFKNGDLNEFRKYIQANINYSESLINKDNVITIIQFVVDNTGTTYNFKIIQSCGISELDNEAIRVIRDSPKWKPAQIGGKAVNQQMVYPVIFEKISNRK